MQKNMIKVLTIINKEARDSLDRLMWVVIDKEKVVGKTIEEIYEICFTGTQNEVESILV